jgi:hypothetical protein
MNMDAAYRDRIIEAFTDLMRHERAPDLDFSEIARRVSVELGKSVPSQTVGKWLREGRMPREADVRVALASTLGVSVGWLFYGEEKHRTNRAPTAKEALANADEGITVTPASRRKKSS